MSQRSQDLVKEPRARRSVSLVARISCQKDSSVGLGKTENISETGVMVNFQQTLPPGSEIKIRFTLPDHTQAVAVEAIGKVVWVVWGLFMGIQFLDLKEEYREAIARFVEETPSSQS